MQYSSEQEKIVYKILYDGKRDVFIDFNHPEFSISISRFMNVLKKLQIKRLTERGESSQVLVMVETDNEIYELILPREYKKSRRIIAQLAIHAGKVTRIFHAWFRNLQEKAVPVLITAAVCLTPVGITAALEDEDYQNRIQLAKIRYDNVMNQIDMGVDEVEAIRLAIEGDIGMELLKKMTPEEQAKLYRDYRDCYQLYKSQVLEDYEPKKSK